MPGHYAHIEEKDTLFKDRETRKTIRSLSTDLFCPYRGVHETGTRLQIGMNVYMKHTGSSYFSFVVCFIMPFIVKCSSAYQNTADSEEKKRELLCLSSAHTFLV